VLDSSGNARSTSVSASGVTRPATGVFAGNALSPANNAYSFNGTAGCLYTSTSYGSFPSTFTLSLWFKSASAAGGPLVQLNNNAAATVGTPTTYDPSVYLGVDGKIYFVVSNGSTNTVSSGSAYDDGAWHHVVAQLTGDEMALFIDGAIAADRYFLNLTPTSVATAYDHLGCGRVRTFTNQPTSSFLNGSIDEYVRYSSPPGRGWIADVYASASW
jgi:hypothetical protein